MSGQLAQEPRAGVSQDVTSDPSQDESQHWAHDTVAGFLERGLNYGIK